MTYAISRVLVQQSHLGIFGCERSTLIDLKGWIANQNYYVDSDFTKTEFELRAYEPERLKVALGNDCDRMASAAIESLSGVREEGLLAKSGAWGLIRTYYATFFAAHSIMRMFGISCSQLESPHTQKLYEVARNLSRAGNCSRVQNGFYEIEIDRSFATVRFRKLKDSHKDTWGVFLQLIRRLITDSENVSARTEQKNQAIEILTAIKRGISRSRCREKGNWLSVIRNSINYQHSHGVWFPYGKRTVAPSCLSKLRQNWSRPIRIVNPDQYRDDIEAFFEVSLLISSFFRELLISCSEKSNSGNRIFVNGSLNLLKNIRAHNRCSDNP